MTTEKQTTIPQKAIVVYGASSKHIDERYKQAAYQLGSLISSAGFAVVCGGGREGLMKEAIEGAVDIGGYAVGVLPQFMVDRHWQHPRLSQIIVTDDMHRRKETMARMSCAAIACPGGCGTFEELLEIITWRQLGLYHGPVVILNTLGYYDPMIEMLNRSIEQGFRRDNQKLLWQVAETPQQAVSMAMNTETEFIPVQNFD